MLDKRNVFVVHLKRSQATGDRGVRVNNSFINNRTQFNKLSSNFRPRPHLAGVFVAFSVMKTDLFENALQGGHF